MLPFGSYHTHCRVWLYILQKADSGDSGTEEPCGEQDFYVKKDDDPHCELQRSLVDRPYAIPLAAKIDRLAERINNLSLPRDYPSEKVPEGLVDSLPPEGMPYVMLAKCFVDHCF